jgi:hypothetical protein
MWSMIAGSQSKDAERKRRFNEVVSRVKVRDFGRLTLSRY